MNARTKAAGAIARSADARCGLRSTVRRERAPSLLEPAGPSTGVYRVAAYRDGMLSEVAHWIPVPAQVLDVVGGRTVGSAATQVPPLSPVLSALASGARLRIADTEDTARRAFPAFVVYVDQAAEPDRVLATILFSDIAGSTQRAIELGDRLWSTTLARYQMLVRSELWRFRGREVDTAGDGLFAIFDAPARAVCCAVHILKVAHVLALDIRVGLHAGECEMVGDRFAGIALHIGARVAGIAKPGEVLVSSTVKDLVAGSELRFFDRGLHALVGFTDPWHLFTVDQASAWRCGEAPRPVQVRRRRPSARG